MSWLTRLLRPPALDAGQRAAAKVYLQSAAPDRAAPLGETRFIVVDVETSGLNPHRDRLISIGALTVEASRVRLDRSFEVVLRQEAPSHESNILVHEIDGTTQVSGSEPAQALTAFLTFSGMAPLVAYHAGFDRAMISRAMDRYVGIPLKNQWLDLAVLAPALLPERPRPESGLDGWLAARGIENYARHNAAADALATAELFLVILAAAARRGHQRLADLLWLERATRWLGA